MHEVLSFLVICVVVLFSFSIAHRALCHPAFIAAGNNSWLCQELATNPGKVWSPYIGLPAWDI
jgi:hypothetical protein